MCHYCYYSTKCKVLCHNEIICRRHLCSELAACFDTSWYRVQRTICTFTDNFHPFSLFVRKGENDTYRNCLAVLFYQENGFVQRRKASGHPVFLEDCPSIMAATLTKDGQTASNETFACPEQIRVTS